LSKIIIDVLLQFNNSVKANAYSVYSYIPMRLYVEIIPKCQVYVNTL